MDYSVYFWLCSEEVDVLVPFASVKSYVFRFTFTIFRWDFS